MTKTFQELYKEKLVSAEEAVKFIEPGDGLVYPLMPGEPPALHEALGKSTTLKDNRLYRMLPSMPTIDLPKEQLHQISIFLSGWDRKLMNSGSIDLLPNHFSDIPSLLLMREPTPVVLATVSPMDADGNFSLGASPSYVASLIEKAKTIILEVNENMPRTFGEKNNIHISQVAAVVENHVPLPELPTPELGEKDLKIGKQIADIVKDGDTIQIGFGSMPNAVMEFLKDKKNLGVHTEMLPDKFVDLCEAGAISNENKQSFKGYAVATFAVGSKRLYDFINNNPNVLMLPCDITNDPRVIAKENDLVAINSTVEVDFLGQCNSERVQSTYYSSSGGQADFLKGVRLTENGTGIICLYSTAKNDQFSTIVPQLFPGSPVTTSKNDVDTVVTEYGVAKLKGKTIQERTQALIDIAHPNFREELTKKAKEMHYLP